MILFPCHPIQSGLKVDPEKHQSRIYAEPVLGIGVKQVARSQVNTFVRDLSGFPHIFQRFSHMVIPIFWGELVSRRCKRHFIVKLYEFSFVS